MEDILASIRRILSEEGEEEGADAESAAEPVATAEPEPEPEPEPIFEPEPAPPPPPPPIYSAPKPEEVLELTPQMKAPPELQVVSPPTALLSTDVLSELAKAILDRRDMSIGARDVTLEGMVREMLRPLLKEWLDRNLPYLIERLVKKEIDTMINRAERLED